MSFASLGLLVGCATAGRDNGHAPDSGLKLFDSDTSGGADTSGVLPDASVTPDTGGGGCTTMMAELLQNGNLDGTPIGTGWVETPINATYPLVTSDQGVVQQSAPNDAWLGGIAQAAANDELHQDVMVPAGTTSLVLTGYYDVRTAETGTTVRDTGKVDLVQTSGTVIEPVIALDNAHPQTGWTPLSYTFTSNVAGQTVRLRFASSNNATNPTSFYFDTLSLQATYCQ